MRREIIEQRLAETLTPVHLEVNDESHRHSVPTGAESHFNLLVVTKAFEGSSRVDRHRQVHELLSDQFAGGLHALTLTLLTPGEYERRAAAIPSPPCLGGSKAD